MSECEHEKGLGYEGECVPCLKAELARYKKAHTVHKLTESQDQSAFVFTARLQYVVKEFEGSISTAAAIGAFEVVKHELIQDALDND